MTVMDEDTEEKVQQVLWASFAQVSETVMADERASIVTWLRAEADRMRPAQDQPIAEGATAGVISGVLRRAASGIERGDHREAEENARQAGLAAREGSGA